MFQGGVLPVIVFLPFAAAMLALAVGRYTGRGTGWLMVAAAGVSFTLALIQTIATDAAAPFTVTWEWIPGLDINLFFRGDKFGLFFALLVAGIGTLVGVYSTYYIPELPNARVGRYYASLIGFMGAMLGIALADDLILLFVFWEITSITSFMLIGFWYEKDEARKGAMTALQVTGLGGLAMMAGFIMIGNEAGTFTISELAAGGEPLEKLAASPLFVPALLCIFAGAFTKSAQWPFHFWLPNAMVAPTPVSTYLHSATMVKAGIFLVGRMHPIFDTAACWSPILTTFGLFTFAYTAYQAFFETDLKAILARTTLSTLGLVMFIYGIKAYDQDALQILNHAAYKGTLFLVVGMVEHATHTRDLRDLGGLRQKMPITFLIGALAALSMAGLPPFFGFAAKESLYAALIENETLKVNQTLHWFVIAVCVLSNAFIFAVSWKIILGVFCGKESDKASHAHEAEAGLWLPAAGLMSLVVVLGLLAFTPLTQGLTNFFSSDADAYAHVALIPTHIEPVLLSAATIMLGVVIYLGRRIVEKAQRAINRLLPTAQGLWDRFLDGVTWLATVYSENWQRGSIRWYFSAILVFLTGLVLFSLYRADLEWADVQVSTSPWYAVLFAVLLGVATVTVVLARTRLQAAVAITATGFLTSMMFVVYRSPDILLTQILIETVATIFILLILFFMPTWRKELLSPAQKLVNMTVSVGVGLAAFLLVLFATSDTFRSKETLAGDYLRRAVEEAGGDNVVNVIIVDFRAIDTTGEIIVLVVVGLIVFSLLRARRKPGSAPLEKTPTTR